MTQKKAKKLIIAACGVALVAWIVLMIVIFGGDGPDKKPVSPEPTETPTPTVVVLEEPVDEFVYRQTKVYYHFEDGDEVLFFETIYDEHGKPIRFDQYDRDTGELVYSKNAEYDADGNLVYLPQYDCEYTFKYDKERGLTYMNCTHYEGWDTYYDKRDAEAVVDADGKTIWYASWFAPDRIEADPFNDEAVLRFAAENASVCILYRYTYMPDGRRKTEDNWSFVELLNGEFIYLSDTDTNPDSLLYRSGSMDSELIQYEYDTEGHLIKSTHFMYEPDGRCLDPSGKIVPEMKNNRNYAWSEDEWEYDSDGQLITHSQRNKSILTYGDPDDTHVESEIQWDVFRDDYINLENGNRRMINFVASQEKSSAVAQHTSVYEYDANGVMIRADYYGGGGVAGPYGAGNWGFRMEYETYNAAKGDYNGDALQRKMMNEFVDPRAEFIERRMDLY